ncbi:hypothetical protein L345_17036, partial [Ophiophagus hannah]
MFLIDSSLFSFLLDLFPGKQGWDSSGSGRFGSDYQLALPTLPCPAPSGGKCMESSWEQKWGMGCVCGDAPCPILASRRLQGGFLGPKWGVCVGSSAIPPMPKFGESKSSREKKKEEMKRKKEQKKEKERGMEGREKKEREGREKERERKREGREGKKRKKERKKERKKKERKKKERKKEGERKKGREGRKKEKEGGREMRMGKGKGREGEKKERKEGPNPGTRCSFRGLAIQGRKELQSRRHLGDFGASPCHMTSKLYPPSHMITKPCTPSHTHRTGC